MKQVISIVLSLLLLLSSSGLTYAQHFCGEYEMMSKITLGEEHLSCGMEMMSSTCEDSHEDDHNCCDNEYTTIDVDDNFATSSFDIQLSPVFVIAFVSVFVVQEPYNYDQNFDYYKDYSPPPLGEDLQVLYDTFLI
ncbi:MAG: hypothetical protein AAF489_02995 [Bacteroidota bacterium]